MRQTRLFIISNKMYHKGFKRDIFTLEIIANI